MVSSAMERDDQPPGHAPGDNNHSRPASHAPAHDHAHPDGSLHKHSEERVTFSPIAAPLGAATLASDNGTAPTDMACDQSEPRITSAPSTQVGTGTKGADGRGV